MNFLRLNRGLYKRLHKYFVYQIRKKHYRNRAKVLVKNIKCSPLSKTQIKEVKSYYKSFGFKNINTDWHRFYSHLANKFCIEYIPVDFYINVIEPHLNMKVMHPALSDKNLLNKIFSDIKQPETIVKNINGIFLGADNKTILGLKNVIEKCNMYSKLIIKPSIESGGGKNIIVFEINKNKTDYKNKTIDEIVKLYGKNFIIQNYMIQHDLMNKLNPDSLNTLRIQTLFINNKIELVTSIVRIGGKGSKVDNISSGGIFCNIDEDGFLDEFGYDLNGNFVYKTDTKVILNGFRVPNFEEIIRKVKTLHQQVPYFRIISWDIAIDKIGDPVLIEFNIFSQYIDHQYATGPLFGKFTNEILRECKVRMFG